MEKWRKIYSKIHFHEYIDDRYIYHKNWSFFKIFSFFKICKIKLIMLLCLCNLNVYSFIIILSYSYQIERLFSFFKDRKFERKISSSRSACRKMYSSFSILRAFDHCLSYSLRMLHNTRISCCILGDFSFFKTTLIIII